MATRDPRLVMWVEACRMLERAEQLQRQFCEPVRSASGVTAWEPPVDMFEVDGTLWVTVALPGVTADDLEVTADANGLAVAGVRRLPAQIRGGTIHRLELPHGRFERRIRLPARGWVVKQHALSEGCLILRLQRGA